MVRGGWYHFLLLNTMGEVSCWIGENRQTTYTGVTYTNCQANPAATYCVDECVPVEAPAGHPLAVPAAVSSKAVKDICCGAYHNLVRFEDDSIACWGLNSMGQCNTPATLANGTHPKRKKIVGLHAGYSTSAVTFNDGTVLCWGDPAVADVVNGWTNIMMSPVNQQVGSGMGHNDIDNYDAASPAFAKPRYSAAYNTDAALVTWNLQSDSKFYWHTESANSHCVPYFDLGVEVDPWVPLEWNPEQNGMQELAATGTVFPFWNAGFENPACDVACATTPNSDAWRDLLAAKWRNRVFQATGGTTASSVTRSCCDLEVKKDYAVALRRTGQIVSTRNTNRHPTCPAGFTDGRSNCRDCSADNQQTVGSGTMTNWRANCPPNINDLCIGAFATCQCCSAGANPLFLGCPDCSSFTCNEQARFGIASPEMMCDGNAEYHEGTGCIGSNERTEFFYYNPNWAGPGNSLANRWTAGVQVRNTASGGPIPPANGEYEQNYGWSTFGTQDDIDDLQTTGINNCSNIHPATDSCAEICKGSGHSGATIEPDGSPSWNYPQHMFAQGIVLGTDTTVWIQQSVTLTDEAFVGETCGTCATASADSTCAHNLFQGSMPNGGDLTYSCIYSGAIFDSAGISRDKYGYINHYRGGVNLQKGVCDESGAEMYDSLNRIDPSKPWGPFHIFVENSLGNDKNYLYPECHCCPPGEGIQKRPPGIALVSQPGSGAFSVQSNLSTGLDPVIGTHMGFPFEANMHCQPDPINGDNYMVCEATCAQVASGGQGPSTFASTFCAYHAPRSVASTRMAFAMIRADHRAYDGSGTQLTPPGRCGAFPPDATTSRAPYEDQSQWLPCDGLNPVIRNDMVLHIWGSLWDPCPPWPRSCVCTAITSTLPCAATAEGDYTTPCDASHPEGDADTDGGEVRYPHWTLVPTSNPTRLAARGQWISGVWTYITGAGAGNEASGPNTRYCPDCSSHTQQWSLEQQQY